MKFVIVFFDDILVYNASLVDHKDYLKIVFETLVACKTFQVFFGRFSMGFLGHIISSKGVHPNSEKINTMVD